MIEQIQLFLKDPAKMSRAATVLFFVMVVFIAMILFNLRHDLKLAYSGGVEDSARATVIYSKLFITIGFALVFCYAMIFYAQLTKKETIVYIDKKSDSNANQSGQGSAQSQDSFNIETLKEKLKSGSREEKWQSALNELCHQLNAGQGALYQVKGEGENKMLELTNSFALVLAEGEQNPSFSWGEGLIGNAASSGSSTYLDELPEGYSARIASGLGSALPKFIFIFPIKKENECIGVMELATFNNLSEAKRKLIQESGSILADINLR